MPIAVDTLLLPRWILPIRPAAVVLEDHAVAISQGRLLDICPAGEALLRYTAAEVVPLADKLLMPGLVNAHGHAAMTLLRGLADDLPLLEWLNEHIWPAEKRWVSEAFVASGSRLAIAEMLRGGTTTFADMYFYPDVTARVAAEIGMRCQIAFPILDFPTAWASDANDYIHKGLLLIDEYRHSELISFAFGPHAPYTVSDEPLRRIASLAHQMDRPIQIHLHETAFEVEDAVARSGQRPLARLEALGLLTPQTQCVHMTQINAEDLRMLAATGAQVVHCPQSNLKLASGFCPVQRLREAGVNVALGTDGAASNNDLDLWEELRLAALLAKAVAGNAAAVPASAALEMATLGGARALGLDDSIGSLEVGKQADCIAVDLSPLHAQPLYQPLSQLVYATRAEQVSDVWVKGRRQVAAGDLVRLSPGLLRHDAQQWREMIQRG